MKLKHMLAHWLGYDRYIHRCIGRIRKLRNELDSMTKAREECYQACVRMKAEVKATEDKCKRDLEASYRNNKWHCEQLKKKYADLQEQYLADSELLKKKCWEVGMYKSKVTIYKGHATRYRKKIEELEQQLNKANNEGK